MVGGVGEISSPSFFETAVLFKEAYAIVKRFLCAVLVTAVLFVLAACSSEILSSSTPSPTPSSSPTSSSTSRNVQHSAPVAVSETYAKADVVTDPAPAATPSSTAAPVDTPSTGDNSSVIYFVGVLGLILVCSAGLWMLKRI